MGARMASVNDMLTQQSQAAREGQQQALGVPRWAFWIDYSLVASVAVQAHPIGQLPPTTVVLEMNPGKQIDMSAAPF